MNEVTANRSVEMITTEIITIKRQTASVVASAAFEIGRRLCEAKEKVAPGGWITYLQERLDYKPSTAENLMRIYREFGNEQVDMLTGKSPAEVFGRLDQSQMVAMFSLNPAQRMELVEQTPEIEEMSSRQIAELAKQKKAAEEEAARERKARERADKIAVEQADKAKKLAGDMGKRDQQIKDLENELERVRADLDAEKAQTSIEPPDTSEKDARISELEAQIKEMKARPIEATYVPEDVKQELRKELQGEIDAANMRAAAAEQKAVNLQNQDAQAINYAFKEIQAKFADTKAHLAKFSEINPEKAAVLARAIAQTLRRFADVIDR